MQKPNIGNALSTSLWFLPAATVLAAAAAAVGLVTLDESLGSRAVGGSARAQRRPTGSTQPPLFHSYRRRQHSCHHLLDHHRSSG